MKFLRILFFAALVFLMVGAAPAHKFYVSITKIEYASEKKSLQIITKIFTDDIEDALQQRYNPSVSLGTKKETAEYRALLKKYILQKLNLKVNGKEVTLNYLGQEYESDMVISYIEVTGVTDIKDIEIENKLLMEIFPEQQNIIHLKTASTRRSLILERENSSGEIKFQD